MRAIRFEKTGGPDVLQLQEIAKPQPGPGQVLVRLTAIGVNFIDTYHRTGFYEVSLPSGLGQEAAGVIEALGPGVTDWKPGERVAFMAPLTTYAEYSLVAADRTIRLPDSVSDEIAASALLKGMTARVLLKIARPTRKGDTIVWHAAAGGVGQIATQWAAHLGARVIGVVGSEAKAAIAKANGCAEVIVSPPADIAKTVRALTNGEGVPVVYDSVGKDTFDASLDSLAPLGLLVLFGAASGPPPPLNLGVLAAKGSLYVTRQTLFTHTRTAAGLHECAGDLFAALADGAMKIAPPTRYTLEDAAQAHRDLEGRKTTGSLVLIP
jgi:NADPH2:quinone reductase